MNQPAEYIGGATPNKMTRRLSDIQGLVGAPIEDGWTTDTSEAVREWQLKHHLDVTGHWDYTSDLHGFPRNELLQGLSYQRSEAQNFHPMNLVSEGFHHVGRMLLDNADGLTRNEYELFADNDVPVWYIYYADEGEFLGGEWGGENLAQQAEMLRVKNDLPKKPIYFAVSSFIDPSRYGTVLESLRGVAHVIGFERTGLLAPHDLLKEAFDEIAIMWGAQAHLHSDYRWESRAHLQEYAVSQWGGSANYFRASALEFGQSETNKMMSESEITRIIKRQVDLLAYNLRKTEIDEGLIENIAIEVYDRKNEGLSKLDESQLDSAIAKALAKKFAAG